VIVIDTPEGIERFRLLQLKYALKVEIDTGMRHSRGSILVLINERYEQKFTRKAQALEFVERLLGERE
jgi:anion-transporting  ArsA/GET3 family ATPase